MDTTDELIRIQEEESVARARLEQILAEAQALTEKLRRLGARRTQILAGQLGGHAASRVSPRTLDVPHLTEEEEKAEELRRRTERTDEVNARIDRVFSFLRGRKDGVATFAEILAHLQTKNAALDRHDLRYILKQGPFKRVGLNKYCNTY